MNDNQLVALIKRYYPRSERWPALRDPSGWMYFCSWLIYLALGVRIILICFSSPSVETWNVILGGFGVFGMISFGIVLPLRLFVNLCGQYKIDPDLQWYAWPFLPLRHFNRWRRFQRMLRNPYSSELILGTVEAVEAEIEALEEKAVGLVTKRRLYLQNHQWQVTEVIAQISGRLNSVESSENDEILLLTKRRLDGEEALRGVSLDLRGLAVEEENISQALVPARALASGLRRLYRDTTEVEIISRAKAAVANDEDRERVRKQLLAFYHEALVATEALKSISEAVGSKIDAERQLEALIGIAEPPEVNLRA